MNQKGLAPILIVLLIALALGGYFLYQQQAKPASQPTTQTTQPSPSAVNEKGYLGGKVEFVGKPCPLNIKQQVPPCNGLYSNYEIVIYQHNDKTIVAKTLSDKNGQYRLSLKPGSYIIYTPKGTDKGNTLTNQATITNNQTTILNLVIDTGIR